MDSLIAIIGTIVGVGGPVLVVYLFLHYSSRKSAKRLDTLVQIVEKGVTVEPEMLEMLNEPSGPRSDLRKGMIWLAIGIPLTLGIMLEVSGTAWVFGLIPVFIGIAYLLAMKFDMDKEKDKQAQNSQLG